MQIKDIAMSSSLQGLLEYLHDVLKKAFAGREIEASNIVRDIVSNCQDLLTASDIAYGTSLLFNDEYGTLSFITKTVQLKEFENAKSDLLKFLAAYSEKIGDKILPYTRSIKDLCLLVVNRDSSSKAKIESYNLLMQLIHTKDKDIQEKLDVPALATKLFSLCLQSTKHPAGVRGALFNVLGVISETFPQHMTDNAVRLLSIYTGTLKQQMITSKKPEFLVVGGCLRGLNGYLASFTQSMEEQGSASAKEIFSFIRKAIDPEVLLSRYEIPRAALALLERHSFLFRHQMMEEWQFIYNSLCYWSKHGNKEVKTAGLKAWDSCLYQISKSIVSQGKNAKTMKIIRTFMEDFHSILNAESSSPKELSLAVKGFGLFAEACMALLNESDVKLIFDEILNRSQHMLDIEYLSDETLQYLPTFLEALASIIQQFNQVSAVHLVPLERMIVILFENYPKLGKGGMFVFEKSLTHFIRALSVNTTVFKVCLSQIVYQGLIRTCSHPVITEEGVTEEEMIVQDSKDVEISYRSFINLWMALLSEKNYKNPKSFDDSTKSQALKEHVFDEFIQAILLMAKKLNLGTDKKKAEIEELETLNVSKDSAVESCSDPLTGLVANVPKDFQIFINLVEFCRTILLRCEATSFSRWIPVFIKEFITLSSRYPLVSGFYKLMEIGARLCTNLGYFQIIDTDSSTSELSECKATFLLMSKYVKDVLGQIRQFKDDLLSSCLQFVLSLPIQIVEANIESFITPLQLSLKLGLSYHPLAVSGLDALESWRSNIPAWKMKRLLADVLPFFDRFLHVSPDKSGIADDNEEPIVLSQSSHSRRNRVPIKLLKALRDASKPAESPMTQFRYRIVQFLGNLGGSINIDIIKEGSIPDLSRAVTWDTKNHLSFALPFWDIKPTVYLDPFLPRVIELATTSSDRQTKVVACELLHALTLFILGKSTQQTNQNTNKDGMEGIYRHLFPAILKLGCDIEQVAEQLFRPLVSQMIHWFTSSPGRTESPDTIILLDSILDGLVCQDNSSLRDFSAKCIREFLDWSIRQTSSKQLSKTAVNPKAVFKRIYSMASHPSVYKRLGAAVAFNNIYITFREHEELVDAYSLELLTVFIDSLAMAHHDDPGTGTVDQTKDALSHLERIIKQKSSMFFKISKNRRIPGVLKNSVNELTLDHVFVWLLRQCGSPKTECRHKCMELLFTLLPTRPGISHARIWFENTIKSDGFQFLIDRFEGGGFGDGQNRLPSTITKASSSFKIRYLVGWYEGYLAALDCYIWLTRLQLAKLGPLLLDSNSVLLQSIEYVTKELALDDLGSIRMKCLRAGMKEESHVLTPMDKEIYNKAKCTAVVRSLDFLATTLATGIWKSDKFENAVTKIFSKELFSIICKCILHPESLGFNIADIDVLQKLPDQMKSLCMMLKRGLPLKHYEVFIKQLASHLSKQRYDLTVHLPMDFRNSTLHGNEKFLEIQQLVAGYELLNGAGLLSWCMSPQEFKSLRSELISNVLNGLLPLSGSEDTSVNPSQKRLAESMLQLVLQLESENNSLVEILLDLKPVQDHKGAANLSPRGAVFYQLFSPVINEVIVDGASSLVSVLIEKGEPTHPNLPAILQGILEHVGRFSQKRSETKTTSKSLSVMKEVLGKWMTLNCWWKSDAIMERKVTILAILRCLLIINPQETLQSSGSNASPTLATYLQLLSDRQTGLAFKGQMFELLPQLFEGLHEDKKNILRDALKGFIARSFPLCSADLMKGTSKYSEYIGCLQKLFKSLVTSSSHVLLDVLLTIIVRETDEVTEKIILPSLKLYFRRIDVKEAEKSLNMCIDVLISEDKYSNSIRSGVMDRILSPVFQCLEAAVLKKFFKENVKVVMQMIETKLIKVPESVFETQLHTKICCFKIMQSLYVLLDKDEATSEKSAIVKAYLPSAETGRELTQAITKLAHAAKSEDCRGETALTELRRQYHCAAYNALCAVIASTQSEMKFYSVFLFTENIAKGQMLWNNIVDNTKEFRFEAEQTVPFARKKQLQMIRRKLDADSNEDEFEAKGFVPYLSSQYLMDSSLSQDVSQFDFSTPIQAYSSSTNAEFLRSQQIHRKRDSSEDEEGEDAIAVTEDVLEMDEVNRNECMPVLVSLLRHMRDSGVYKQPPEGREGSDLPAWMKCLLKKMTASDTTINVQIFILKLIINEPKVFEPYGKSWFSPIVKLLISEKINGAALNYFVIDAIVVMLSWSTTCIPEDSVVGRNLASSLLDFLVKNCHHNNRAVLKNNLQVIKTLTNVWKDLLDVPYKFVYDHFTCKDRNTKDNMTGIQLLGVLLTNGFPAYLPNCGVDEQQYYDALTINIQFKYKDVFASAAEVIGLAIKNIGEKPESFDCPIFAKTYERLIDLHASYPDRFIMCLHRIQLNYPMIVDKFLNQLLYILPSLHGILKQQCLESIASRIEHFEEPQSIFTELKNKGLDSALNHRDEGVQIAALGAFNGLLKHLKAVDVLPFLDSIAKFKSHASVTLRQKMYDMLMWIYDTYRADEQTMLDEASLEVLKLSKETLLLGINDNNTDISLKILNFWRHETRLPNSTIERFIEILRALYSTKTEKEYLSYSTNLLLQLTSLSPDYTLPLFSEPLDSSKRFQEYHVNFSWQRQKIAMTPLFAATQSQSQVSSQFQRGSSSLSTGMLRATQQNLEFTPTQEQGGGASLDWMNPSFQVGSQESSPSQSLSNHGSFLFVSQGAKVRGHGSEFNKGRLGTGPKRGDGDGTFDVVDSGHSKPEGKAEILRLKRRIMKSQEKANLYFAIKQRRAQRFRETIAERQKAARDHKIVMYRKYRAGELPDIQIKHSELIVPLQAAAQHDAILARQLFQTLFDAITREIAQKPTEEKDKAYVDIQDAVNEMVNNSFLYHPPFIYALVDACVRHERLKLDAAAVATASAMSLQQPAGIILLEKQLIENNPVEPESKRRRKLHAQNGDIITWTKLAKLYKSIDNYDFVHSIFCSQITKQDDMRLALESEARNDYIQALKLYIKVSSTEEWNGNEPSQEEEEFWDIARLECYNNLGQWSQLKNLTLQCIDEDTPADNSKIWDDVYLQELFLPYYMRSNVKLLCQGKVNEAKGFDDFINDALREEGKREILESKYCNDLALIRILQDDFGAAAHYINLGMQSFMEEWSHLSLLMSGSRFKALSKLQCLYEMKEFANFFSKQDDPDLESIKDLLGSWSRRNPDDKVHSVSVWDDVIINRCVYVKKIKQKVIESHRSNQDEIIELLDTEESKSTLLIADIARKQGNYSMAKKYLRDSFPSTLLEKAKENGFAADWYHVYSKVDCDISRKLPTPEAVSSLVKVLEQLHDNKPLAKDSRRRLNHHLVESTTLDCLADVIKNHDQTNVADLFGDEQHSIFAKIYGTQPTMQKDYCKDFFHQYSYSGLHSGLALSSNLNESFLEGRRLTEKAVMTMVKFCDNRLKESEEVGQEVAKQSEYAFTVVRYLMKAMTLDSIEARQRFPRLLQIINRYPETMHTFSRQAIGVPSWMFLGWLNQIVALVDKEEGPAVQPILKIIAGDYPRAMAYPLRISSEQYSFDETPEGRRNKAEFERLYAEIKNPLCDDFIDALHQLTNPEHIFKDWSDSMCGPLRVKKRDEDAIKDCFASIWNKLFKPVDRSEKIRGEIRGKSSKEFSKVIQNYFGKDGSQIVHMPYKDFSEKCNNLYTSMRKVHHSYNLKGYSPWFSTFHEQQTEDFLEIPGQYHGRQKPLLEYHVRIAGFDERVLAMQSLRIPKRITIRGHDEKEYKFLVKGNEDLRLDQRIEQLFDIMNGILAEDPACNMRALKLKTYQVIPLTSRIGVIEWMENTVPLRDLLMATCTEEEKDFLGGKRSPLAQYRQLVERYPSYVDLYENASRTEVVKIFERIQALIPWDLLRRAFDNLSTSTEALFVLRKHFIQTYSCLCICQYILGIGDRHLSNLMLDIKTGGMVGIDFGYSFGVATTILPIPELMPFRLTRQFTNFLLPLKDPGPYRLPMISVLRALQNNSDILLSTMDIFVNEPLIDWQSNALKQSMKMDNADTSASWYPKEKISICKLKLSGVNSCYITGEELRLGKSKKPGFQAMQAVAYGSTSYNIRAKLLKKAEGEPSKHFLTTEEQVACLIDQATDPNLLGRTFIGWQSFF